MGSNPAIPISSNLRCAWFSVQLPSDTYLTEVCQKPRSTALAVTFGVEGSCTENQAQRRFDEIGMAGFEPTAP
ncbi:MAG: hypothetical protein AAGF24_10755, partial [Cyanobacteria bacterium P01_H01_bin.121]